MPTRHKGKVKKGAGKAMGDPVRLAQGLAAIEDLKAISVLTLESIAEAVTGAGLASAYEVAAALADLRAFAATPGTLIGDPRTFQVWAERPRTA